MCVSFPCHKIWLAVRPIWLLVSLVLVPLGALKVAHFIMMMVIMTSCIYHCKNDGLAVWDGMN